MNWKIILGVLIFIIIWGVVGHYDYEDAVETQKQKEELEEYLNEG